MTAAQATTPREVLETARQVFTNLKGRTVDVLDIKQPPNAEDAHHLAKVISKLSPLVGNMLEYFMVEYLNQVSWIGGAKWRRQDPGFPDTIFDGSVLPVPGIEVKTWFPLATEITARFKDSTLRFMEDNVDVAVVAWLPEYVLYGRPKVIDVWIDSAKSLAEARDRHYHDPPDYLVLEPEDTTARTANLQQTNTNGYKFQGTRQQMVDATVEVESWGSNAMVYSPYFDYQLKIKGLLGKYPYRLDTNFAKIDRIEHEGLERFKTSVLAQQINGRPIGEWVPEWKA